MQVIQFVFDNTDLDGVDMKATDQSPYTTDLRIHLIADSVIELFQTGLEGMNEILRPGECQEYTTLPIEKQLDVQAPDLAALLVDFLSEVLTLSQLTGAIYCEFKVDELTNNRFIGTVSGRKVDFFEEDINTVDTTETEVHLTVAGQLETVILFDM